MKISDDTLMRQQNAAMLLSTAGAAFGGVGLGVLLSKSFDDLGFVILLVGLLAHGVGMLGNRRAQRSEASFPRGAGRLLGLLGLDRNRDRLSCVSLGRHRVDLPR